MRKILHVCICALAVFVFSPINSYGMTKENVKKAVRQEVENVLSNQIKFTAPEKRQEIHDTVLLRAERAAKTIDSLPQQEVDQDLSSWIVRSFAELMEMRASLIVQRTSKSDALFNDIVTTAEKRFKSLNAATIKQLSQRSEKLLSDSNQFSRERDIWIADKFSNAKEFSVDLGSSFGNPSNISQIGRIVFALNLKLAPANVADRLQNDHVDITDQPIESRLLTLSLVREITTYSGEDEKGNFISYDNLFSPAIDDNAPIISVSFGDIKSRAEDFYKKSVLQKGDEIYLNVDTFRFMLDLISYLHWKPIGEDEVSNYLKPSANMPAAVVKFKNYSSSWELIKNQPVGNR